MGNDQERRSTDASRPRTLEELRQIEEELLAEVTAAREAYLAAVLKYKGLLGFIGDLGTLHPDGTVALKSAIELQQSATHRYSAALKAFNDFILHEKTPKEPNVSPPGT